MNLVATFIPNCYKIFNGCIIETFLLSFFEKKLNWRKHERRNKITKVVLYNVYFEMSENVKDSRKNALCRISCVYQNFCPTLYSFLWSNNEQRFEAACQLFCCWCCCYCSKVDGRIGVDFSITEVVLEFIVSFAFLTLSLSLFPWLPPPLPSSFCPSLPPCHQ